ncbi:MAG: tRNA lysidine(34) synthetase TilS [Firmicutes bacterium]|nr:tRNA lysidine(34) synthetase TilS [Bacillota bacterium]MDY5676517.1 tRNA lysidine(34) synthetase TilS [Eubacteriales bacterium]
MENILKNIKKRQMLRYGDRVAVACSGGKDSMCLLNFLWTHRDELGITVCAVNVDHGIRENSANDSEFVINYCQKNGIKVYSFKVNAKQFAEDKKLTLEQGARECRYRVFKSLINKNLVDKIALAHHLQDQAETILLNIFRGTGIGGASGMDYVRDDIYIRPMLDTSKASISAYIESNDIPYVEDETNDNSEYNRNYIRNQIMPLIRNRWQNADSAIVSFGANCREDDSYIESTISSDALLVEDGIARVYINYFINPASYTYRLILRALKAINMNTNIEKKHLKMICNMALESENGTKISLPNGLTVIKEYNFVTFTNRNIKPSNKTYPFTKGKLDISNFGLIETNIVKKFKVGDFTHLIDATKLPKDAIWRFRKDGDVFEKFGGGTNSLSDYLIDKKIPLRLRNLTPVLASGSEIYIIAGVEISDKVKVDKSTKTAYGINVVRF